MYIKWVEKNKQKTNHQKDEGGKDGTQSTVPKKYHIFDS